jgi:hypothetical protein
MGDLRKIAEALFYSLLPDRARGRWRAESSVLLERAALLSALLELLAGGCTLLLRFHLFFVERTILLDAATQGRLSHGNEGTQLYGTWIILLDFFVQPATLLLMGMAAEGAVRAVAAGFMDEVLPSLPVALASMVLLRKGSAARVAGALPDSVRRPGRDGVELQICSSAEKPWERPMTLELSDDLFELMRAERVPGEQPFVYSFRRQPAAQLIRRLVKYRPS